MGVVFGGVFDDGFGVFVAVGGVGHFGEDFSGDFVADFLDGGDVGLCEGVDEVAASLGFDGFVAVVGLVAVVGSALFDDVCFYAEVCEFAVGVDADVVEDVEFCLLERGSHFVLDNLGSGAVADSLPGGVLDGPVRRMSTRTEA